MSTSLETPTFANPGQHCRRLVLCVLLFSLSGLLIAFASENAEEAASRLWRDGAYQVELPQRQNVDESCGVGGCGSDSSSALPGMGGTGEESGEGNLDRKNAATTSGTSSGTESGERGQGSGAARARENGDQVTGRDNATPDRRDNAANSPPDRRDNAANSPPDRRDNAANSRERPAPMPRASPLGGIARTAAIVVVIIAILLLLFYFISRRMDAVAPVKEPEEPMGEEPDIVKQMRAQAAHESHAALADQGRYDEAIHILLLTALTRLFEQHPKLRVPSLTSRELLRKAPLEPEVRAALQVLVEAVEAAIFGRRPASQALYLRCLAKHAEVMSASKAGHSRASVARELRSAPEAV